MAKASAALAYPWEYYQPTAQRLARTLTDKQAREEYTRLRAIANKRIKRLGESEFRNTEAYTQNMRGFPALKDIPNMGELAQQLNEVARFVSSNRSSVSGQRDIMKRTKGALVSHGVDFVQDMTPEEYLAFMRFMDHWRDIDKGQKQRDSERVLELFFQARRLNLRPSSLLRDFNEWYNNVEELQAMEAPANPGKNPSDASRLRKRLGVGRDKLSKQERAERAQYLRDLEAREKSMRRR